MVEITELGIKKAQNINKVAPGVKEAEEVKAIESIIEAVEVEREGMKEVEQEVKIDIEEKGKEKEKRIKKEIEKEKLEKILRKSEADLLKMIGKRNPEVNQRRGNLVVVQEEKMKLHKKEEEIIINRKMIN